MIKSFFIKISLLLILLSVFAGRAFALDSRHSVLPKIIRLTVTGDRVNLRSEPSERGKVLNKAYIYDRFFAEAEPYIDKASKDTSYWYKIIFLTNDFDGSIIQAQKVSWCNFLSPYINARFVRPEPLSAAEEAELEWFRGGRPPRINTGDQYDPEVVEHMDKLVLRESLRIRLFPNISSEFITVPKGAVILETLNSEIYLHTDMDETAWYRVIGENGKILGWTQWVDWEETVGRFVEQK
ncbi:hypothetical protein AGMMS50276_17070 [Synergistales bacterium]|nr:hypothetical protein AGMMS50276_17070 [Synergistales bacterium]